MNDKAVLKRFGLSEAAYLGEGAEARVYALDEERIVRVADPRTGRDHLERLKSFYEDLDASSTSFQVPHIHDIGLAGGLLYTIEDRIAGQDMLDVIDTLQGSRREAAIQAFIHTAWEVQSLGTSRRSLRLPIADPGRIYPTFSRLLIARVERAGRKRSREARQDLPGWDTLFARWSSHIQSVDEHLSPTLVHGDFFPGNVMATKTGTVTGVIDFSNLTMFGDPRLDLVSALAFLDQLATWTPHDEVIARQAIPSHVNLGACEDLYRQFYALYFTPFAYQGDELLYAWCQKVVNEALV